MRECSSMCSASATLRRRNVTTCRTVPDGAVGASSPISPGRFPFPREVGKKAKIKLDVLKGRSCFVGSNAKRGNLASEGGTKNRNLVADKTYSIETNRDLTLPYSSSVWRLAEVFHARVCMHALTHAPTYPPGSSPSCFLVFGSGKLLLSIMARLGRGHPPGCGLDWACLCSQNFLKLECCVMPMPMLCRV